MRGKLGDSLHAKLGGFLRSGVFFGLTLLVLICSSAWIALSGRYSLPYDENTHFANIQILAERPLPFWSETHPGTILARDPSYLYLYFLSFIYRFVDLFLSTQMSQVIAIRFVNIAVFLAGIVVFRKVLLAARAPRALVHLALALLVLLPATPLLAAQINYDNALFLVTGVTVLLTLKLTEKLKKSGTLDIKLLSFLASVCLLGSLVKFAYLPIFFAVLLWLVYIVRKHSGWRQAATDIGQGFIGLSRKFQVGLVLLLVVSTGLFMERYGVNLARYSTPLPECNQVLSIRACYNMYSPWTRNYMLRQQKLAGQPADKGPYDPITFTARHWFRRLSYELFFALNGRTDYFKIGTPLPIPMAAGLTLFGAGAILVLHWYQVLRRHYFLDFFLLVTVVYLGGLWLQEYMDFLHLGQAVAIQGRYVMPVLPLILIIVGLAYRKTLIRLPNISTALATMALAILLTQGGGATVFILRSDERWYWQRATVVRANKSAQKVLKRIVVGE